MNSFSICLNSCIAAKYVHSAELYVFVAELRVLSEFDSKASDMLLVLSGQWQRVILNCSVLVEQSCCSVSSQNVSSLSYRILNPAPFHFRTQSESENLQQSWNAFLVPLSRRSSEQICCLPEGVYPSSEKVTNIILDALGEKSTLKNLNQIAAEKLHILIYWLIGFLSVFAF